MTTTRSEQRGRPMPAQYRQGDVLLCRVSKVHSGSPVPPDAGGRARARAVSRGRAYRHRCAHARSRGWD